MLNLSLIGYPSLILLVAGFAGALYLRHKRMIRACNRGQGLADSYNVLSCLLELGSILVLMISCLTFCWLLFAMNVLDTAENLRALQLFIQDLHSQFFDNITRKAIAIIFLGGFAFLVCFFYINNVQHGVIAQFRKSKHKDKVISRPTPQMERLNDEMESLNDQIQSMECRHGIPVISRTCYTDSAKNFIKSSLITTEWILKVD